MIINATEWVKKFSQPGDPNQLINELTKRLLRIDISATSKQQLKRDILLGGQSDDKYWTDAWNLFLSTPGNTSNTNTVKNRLRDLTKYIMNLPEYQLS